ncbi:hypothetical protein OS493_010364 [Desmophyllum pertusum]|uniref:B box-type domain-containing protein n=1 Tax=Desmophyllum pertusum TaxID=174260 RepID=A0A9X0DAM8_9CNID|nr:hypothetical protein OS493_010364 [Desmophyllum pertusum]
MVWIPQGKVDSLLVNFFLNNLLSVVSLHGDSEDSNLECDNCESGDPPVNRCATCCHFLCEFCTQGHRRGRGTRSHNLMSLEEAKQMGSVAVMKPCFCKEHQGELIKLFCETCDEVICRDCTIVKHRDHKYTFVNDAFSKGKESVLKILSETKTKASTLKEALDGVSEMKRNVQSHAEQTLREVITCFQELTTHLNTRCEELIHDIEELRKSKLKSLEIQQGELETALGSVESSVEFTERALENGSEVEILNMHKQMSCRLQELNSAEWKLEPCADDAMKFKAQDKQLKQEVATFGVITDVATHAGTSTVTMGHGSEGVMYNTLCGQSVEFTIIAKERNGRKRIQGGDIFEVEICTEAGEIVFNDSSKDCGNGTHSFHFTPNQLDMLYQLSVELNGCHVNGSPFTWFNEIWNLCSEVRDVRGANTSYIQLTTDCMKDCITAKYCWQQQPSYPNYGDVVGLQHSGRHQQQSYRHYGNRNIVWRQRSDSHQQQSSNPHYGNRNIVWRQRSDSHQQQSLYPHYGTRNIVGRGWHQQQSYLHYGNVVQQLSGGRSRISGNVSAEFAFGVGVSPETRCPCESQWTWKSGHKCQPSSQPQQSTFTNCMNNDIIEFYLDCDNKTLMMYNQRSKEFDTWEGLQGEVRPMFEMYRVGDALSLPCLLMLEVNKNEPEREEDANVDYEYEEDVW